VRTGVSRHEHVLVPVAHPVIEVTEKFPCLGWWVSEEITTMTLADQGGSGAVYSGQVEGKVSS
jgi:hypothetical protein